jgi:hypothetical protein
MPTVMIVCRKSSAHVRPAQRIAKPGQDVTFKAIRSDVTLFFPNPALFGCPSARLDSSNGREATLTVQNKVPRDVYPFAAYCDDLNDFAQGSSSPEMIVE